MVRINLSHGYKLASVKARQKVGNATCLLRVVKGEWAAVKALGMVDWSRSLTCPVARLYPLVSLWPWLEGISMQAVVTCIVIGWLQQAQFSSLSWIICVGISSHRRAWLGAIIIPSSICVLAESSCSRLVVKCQIWGPLYSSHWAGTFHRMSHSQLAWSMGLNAQGIFPTLWAIITWESGSFGGISMAGVSAIVYNLLGTDIIF